MIRRARDCGFRVDYPSAMGSPSAALRLEQADWLRRLELAEKALKDGPTG